MFCFLKVSCTSHHHAVFVDLCLHVKLHWNWTHFCGQMHGQQDRCKRNRSTQSSSYRPNQTRSLAWHVLSSNNNITDMAVLYSSHYISQYASPECTVHNEQTSPTKHKLQCLHRTLTQHQHSNSSRTLQGLFSCIRM